MIVAIHQPNYIPWFGFFHKMANANIFVLLDDVKHSKSSITHRNNIKVNDKEYLLTLPLENKESIINELVLHKPEVNLKKHWATIESNYRKAKYWSFISNELGNIYKKEWKYLIDLNITIIKLLKDKLEINCDLIVSSELGKIDGENSLRNLNICKMLKADKYLSGTGARSYNDEGSFINSNIEIIYNNFVHPIYPQLGENFIPNLSIIDLIFNCGTLSGQYLKISE